MNETKTHYQKMIAELMDGARVLRAALCRNINIPPEALQAVLEAWPNIKLDRKRTLLEGLQSLNESDHWSRSMILRAPCSPTRRRKCVCAHPFAG